MREITTHHTNEANRAITIEADEPDPENGNASHVYLVGFQQWAHPEFPGSRTLTGHIWKLLFQHGRVREVGVNGITNEALLAIVIDRLEGFQSGKFANSFNQEALDHARTALSVLEARTKEREQRGVEGTHEI